MLNNTQRAANAPPSTNALMDSGLANTGQFSPFSYAHGASVMGKHVVVALVSVLLRGRFPPAIIRTISKLVVNSPKRCTFGARPHVAKKGREIFPPRTNRYAATPVVMKRVVVGIDDSGSHHRPAFILPRSGVPVFIYSLQMGAAAGLGSSSTKSSGRAFGNAATRALTQPDIISPFVFSDSAERSEFSKNETGQVFRVFRKWYKIIVDHLILQYHLIRWREVRASRTPILPCGVTHF